MLFRSMAGMWRMVDCGGSWTRGMADCKRWWTVNGGGLKRTVDCEGWWIPLVTSISSTVLASSSAVFRNSRFCLQSIVRASNNLIRINKDQRSIFCHHDVPIICVLGFLATTKHIFGLRHRASSITSIGLVQTLKFPPNDRQ